MKVARDFKQPHQAKAVSAKRPLSLLGPIGSHKRPIGSHRAPRPFFIKPRNFFKTGGEGNVFWALLSPAPSIRPGLHVLRGYLTFGILGDHF